VSKHWQVCYLVLALTLVASCDSAQLATTGGSGGAQAQRFAAEDFATPVALLRTGSDNGDVDAFWFCTYLTDGEFSDRKQIHLLDDGGALVDGAQAAWRYEQGVLSISNDLGDVAIESLTFDSRLFTADKFAGTGAAGLELNCDWSGPARPGSILLNDAPEGSFDVNGDGIDTLLLTGNIQNSRDSHWQCRSPVHGWERSLHLFADGSAEFDGTARWLATDVNSFEISTGSSTQHWTNVAIAEDGEILYDFFTASLEGDPVECSWTGAPRATVYIE